MVVLIVVSAAGVLEAAAAAATDDVPCGKADVVVLDVLVCMEPVIVVSVGYSRY